MLKNRVIAVIFVRDEIAVQSIKFKNFLPVGRPEIAAESFNMWGVDEIILLDISATHKNKIIDIHLVDRVASACAVPLTVGGGVKTLQDAGTLLEAGADKICINSAILDDNNCLQDAHQKYGCQCMVGAIDFVEKDGLHLIYDYRLGRPTSQTLIDAIYDYIDRGVGELLINDVERDGSQRGFNTDLIAEVTAASSVPIIWCGGAGHPDDFVHALRAGPLSGIAAGNIFHFNEHSINIVKSRVARDIPLRQDTQTNYKNVPLAANGRISKLPEEALERLLFEKLEVEII